MEVTLINNIFTVSAIIIIKILYCFQNAMFHLISVTGMTIILQK